METKEFENRQDAMEFAKQHKGFCEGPFIDENLNGTYIVFYKEV